MYLDDFRDSLAFYDEETHKVLKVVNFQPVLRYVHSEYVSDGRKYVHEILKEYPKYRKIIVDEISEEYYAREYADTMWQRDCEFFFQEVKTILKQCNYEFLSMPKLERKKKITRLEELFSRYENTWKYQYVDFENVKEDYRYILQWKNR